MQAQTVSLKANSRTLFGKKCRVLRRSGWSPANVYGPGSPSVAVEISTRELEHLLTHVPRTSLISLAVDRAKEVTVMVRRVDRKPTTDELYHVDFYRVSMTHVVHVEVPIVLTGESPAAKLHDATILWEMDALPIECLPGDLPIQIEVDIGQLAEIGNAIRVGELALPAGVTTAADADALIVHALAPKIEVPPEEEVVEAAPEAAEAPTESGEARERRGEE